MHEKIENNPLELFHPLIKQWFLEKVGTPTDIQAKAWPQISGKKHVLVTAPTGSGKTLTAFLWAINNFLLNRNAMSSHRVLYISPLKALNNDIRRNLETPLEELRQFFEEANEPFPEIRTAVRSGDTEPKERRQIARNPPEIFITTPESLNILLASKSGRKVLMGISTVILDEIHAVAATKRGTFLITAIDRLVSLCGEFQRIALSATVKPLEKVAEFIGGYKILGADEFQKRRVSIIKSNIRKKYAINVKFPENAGDIKKTEAWWQALTAAFKNVIQQNRSTLFFANSRRMVEKITRFINEEGGEGRVYSHHGSLSKEIRSVVEKRFKDEELSAIISTSSLELGIDIGSVDEVVLIQAPFSIASAIQRIGRSGHGVGKVSRGTFYPIHSRDLIEDAVLAPNITTGCIESIEPMEAPLDVLAQILLSMTLLETMDIDELYTEIRSSSPYHNLSRKEFDLVLEMLAGRYADARIRELKPRILLDRIKNTAKTRDNASLLLFLSGGVIPDRGYFNMRDVNTKAKIGELDEEFVWERSLGDAFPLGNQVWRIQRITHNDVEVARVKKTNSLIPFWRAEEMNRSYFLSEKIGNFLEEANKNIAVTDGVYKKNVTDGVTKTAIKESTVSKNTGEGANPEFQKKLQTHHFMSEKAALELIAYLKLQKKETDASLPHRHHLLVEHFRDPVNTADSKQTVLHTMWGGPVNRPLAFALSAAWEEKYNYTLDVFVNNDCIMLNLPHAFGAQDILALLKPSKLRQLLRSKLESTGYFGARFRENASCALLLPRKGFQNRMPLWLNRLRSKKLMEAVSRYEDFPILLETWRGCMNHDFEIDRLLSLLGEIETGEITITETVTRKPSPFADGIIWRQTNEYMYYGDSPASKLRTNLSDSLLKEVMYSSQLRPRFSDELLEEFRQKLQRVAPGYSPASGEELLQWARERLYIPAAEWHELLEAIARDHELDTTELTASIEERLFRLKRSHSNHARQDELWAIIALENLPAVSRALGLVGNDVDIALQGLSLPDSSAEGDDERNGFVAFLIEWLRYYGPVSRDFPLAVLGVKEVQLSGVLEALREEGEIIIDEFRVFDGKSAVPVEEELCESENLEILLRMRRNRARPSLDPLDIEALPLYLASYQGLTVPGDGPEDLQEAFEKLFGYTAKVGLWETDILPARLAPYYTSWLDSLMRENELLWFGSGNERSGFCFQPDLELFATGPVDSSQRSDG
ncbi:MAG: DEAD/DEAH box helicase, partial [bacterium]|nr:DEAD/DEAH box helicase [bacterium]